MKKGLITVVTYVAIESVVKPYFHRGNQNWETQKRFVLERKSLTLVAQDGMKIILGKSKKLLKMTMPNPADVRQSLLALFMILFFCSR